MTEQLEILSINYHRNGVCGAGFHSVAFNFRDEDGRYRKMVATVFEEKGYCSVIEIEDFANCWRGDVFEPLLRKAIRDRG
jgi:hypothetical protein